MYRKLMAVLLSMAMLLCAFGAAAEQQPLFVAGTYEGTAQGNNGPVNVTVTVSDDAITDIQIGDNDETYYVFMVVADMIPARILENQSLAVDAVSGATNSSRAVIRAVENALSKAMADTSALYREVPHEKGETQTLECDVLVVGAGYSGLVAANRLAQQGVDVLLIEQLDYVGGSGRFATGGFMMASSEESAQAIKDYVSTRYYYDDFPVAEGTPNVERIEKNVDATLDVYQMFEALGVPLIAAGGDIYIPGMPEELASYVAAESSINTYGCWGVEAMKKAYEKQNGRLMLHTKATSLLQDETGAVIGAKAEGADCDYVINAGNVVLATGSYSHNDELLAENIPWRVGDLSCTSIGDDGSAIVMAREAGAVMTEDNYVNGGARVANIVDALSTKDGNWNSSDIVSSVAMIVSLEGERLASEQDDRYFRYYPVMDGLDQFYAVYNAKELESVGLLEKYEGLVSENGPYYKAETLEELAAITGMDAEKLGNSVASFNHYRETGEDIFDASLIDANSFSQDNHEGAAGNVEASGGELLELDEGPYYAVKLTFIGYDIIGGIKTGNEGQVLDADGNAIPGLYGTGFISSRDFYGSGTAHGYCLMIAMSTGMVTADAIVEAGK